MKGFLDPAIRAMGRLRYPTKFAVIGLLVVLAIAALLTAISVNLYGAIQAKKNELAATELIAPVFRVVQLMQQHRGLSAASLSGDDTISKHVLNKQAGVDIAIAEADLVEARHSTLLSSSTEWKAIKTDWEVVKIGVWKMNVAEALRRHGQLIERILHFQVAIADAGGLTLDDEISTYYLSQTLLKSLPEMLERLGKLRAQGIGALVIGRVSRDDEIEFRIGREILVGTVDALRHDLEKVQRQTPAIQGKLSQFERNISIAIATARKLLNEDIIGGSLRSPPEKFWGDFTKAIDIGYQELFTTLLPTLDGQLEARSTRLRTLLFLELGFSLLLVAAAIYISAGVYFSIVESVRRLSFGTSLLAGGDLGARIEPIGDDELTTVARDFNVMAASLDESWRSVVRARDELADALAAANQADQAKDAFLANMSHELRTPLTAVIGMADLARKLSNQDRQRDYLDKIILSGKHLNRIINDLLDLSKIAAGHMEIEARPFRTSELLARCNSVMSSKADEKGLVLSGEIGASVPEILVGDLDRIEQILLNLVGNAIKFTASGEVAMCISHRACDSDRVSLEMKVSDTGDGMSPAALTRLFKPFSQADASISRKFGGTGLGLAVSLKLAQLMDGTIDVVSVEGRGTTFSASICLSLGGTTILTDDQLGDTDSLPTDYHDARVLVADDQAINREIVEALLASLGIQSRMAENGQEVLDILNASETGHFDLVLMDVQMPVMDGLAATCELRRHARFTALPVIAMTAHTMAHEIAIGAEAGMNDHVGKPFDNATIYRVLAKWIPQRKHNRARHASATEVLTEQLLQAEIKTDPLRKLITVDAVAGLAHFGGREERYRHWLADFVATAPVTVDSIRRDVSAADRDSVARTLHSLKGRVGAMGMGRLQAQVQSLELLLKTGGSITEPLASLEKMIEQTCVELAPVLEAEKGYQQRLDHIVWDDAFSVGVGQMDEQHKRLIGMINQLADLSANQNSQTLESFHDVLSAMFTYTQVHFREEEDYLQEINYPDLKSHQGEHDAFARKVADFHLASENGFVDKVDVHKFLQKWLLAHILMSDMEYRHFGQEDCPDRSAVSDISDEVLVQRRYAHCHVLIADDEVFNQELIRCMLEDIGLSVDVASNGEEAIKMARDKRYAVILMDMQMPGMSGIDATQVIRQMSAYEKLPIVAMTASDSEEDRLACKNAGMSDFLTKPVKPAVFFSCLLRWLDAAEPVGC